MICLDPEQELTWLCDKLGGCYADLMGGQYRINFLEAKRWDVDMAGAPVEAQRSGFAGERRNRCENRKTHQCWPSIRTIGEAVRMSENTVRKYIRQLEERGLITTEPTEVITKTGEKRNGNLLFTLRPIQEVIDEYYDRQLEELELATERQRVANLLREQESTV